RSRERWQSAPFDSLLPIRLASAETQEAVLGIVSSRGGRPGPRPPLPGGGGRAGASRPGGGGGGSRGGRGAAAPRGWPDEELPLGRDFSSSYRAFLRFHGDDLGALGAAVGGAVFPGAHGAAVEALLAAARQRGEGVRLVFETAAPDLLALPFEAARLPG